LVWFGATIRNNSGGVEWVDDVQCGFNAVLRPLAGLHVRQQFNRARNRGRKIAFEERGDAKLHSLSLFSNAHESPDHGEELSSLCLHPQQRTTHTKELSSLLSLDPHDDVDE
jgi:hypothetical protein